MSLLKINGRLRFFNRIKSVRKDRPGHYTVESTIGSFHVEGGRPAGGSSRDWFLDGFGDKHINCTSLMDALHCIDNA